MPGINDLRRERAQLNARVQTIAKMEAPTEDDLKEFDSLKVEFDRIGANIERMEAAEKMAAVAAVPVGPAPAAPAAASAAAAAPRDKKAEGEHSMATFFTFIHALDQAKGNPHVARSEVVSRLKVRDDVKASVASAFEQSISMAMNTESASGGGVLVPTMLAQNVIGYLFPSAVVRNTNGGPMEIPMPNGNLDIGRISSAPTGSYTGRNAAVGVTSAGTDKVTLKAKKLTGLIPLAKDLLRMSGVYPSVDAILTNVLGNSMSVAADIGMIRGDGTGNNIKGLRYWAPDGNVLNATVLTGKSTADGTLQQAIRSDFSRLKLALRRQNVAMTRPAYLMHPDSFEYLAALQTTTGAKVFPEVEAEGRFGQIPIGITTQIPTNLTSGGATSNGSEIYLVDWDHWLIGTALPMEVAISYEASYTDSVTGNQVNAFERDETLIRMIVEHDLAPMHAVAVGVLDGVTWSR
jgi:HK97 family phage major capsid protein